jgi:hypothetical protein
MRYSPYKYKHLANLENVGGYVRNELLTSNRDGSLWLLSHTYKPESMTEKVNIFIEISKETLSKLLAGQMSYLDVFKQAKLFNVIDSRGYQFSTIERGFDSLNVDYLPSNDKVFDASLCQDIDILNEYLGVLVVTSEPVSVTESDVEVSPVWVNPEIESESELESNETETVESNSIEVESESDSDTDNQPITTRKGKKF